MDNIFLFDYVSLNDVLFEEMAFGGGVTLSFGQL